MICNWQLKILEKKHCITTKPRPRQVDLAECRLPPKAPLPWAAAAQETDEITWKHTSISGPEEAVVDFFSKK